MALLRRLLPAPNAAGRLWIAGTFAWCVLVVAYEAGPIAHEVERHRNALAIVESRAPVPDLPLLCEHAKSIRYIDHQVRPAIPGGPKYCWFGITDLRRLHPEYATLSDRALYVATWLKTGQPVTVETTREQLKGEVACALLEAVTPTAFVGVGMLLFGWWLQGGRRRRRSPAIQRHQPHLKG
jgi:hypothetical protein